MEATLQDVVLPDVAEMSGEISLVEVSTSSPQVTELLQASDQDEVQDERGRVLSFSKPATLLQTGDQDEREDESGRALTKAIITITTKPQLSRSAASRFAVGNESLGMFIYEYLCVHDASDLTTTVTCDCFAALLSMVPDGTGNSITREQ